MHISEGVLSPEILAGAAVLTIAGSFVGLKQIEDTEIPTMGILSAAFFVASLVHVPAGPVSVHLVLNGLLGMILGWRAFPAILISLSLQAMFFQFGGITTLGVNTLNMAGPAVFCYLLLGWSRKRDMDKRVFAVAAFLCGALSVLFSGLMVGFTLFLSGDEFLPVAKIAVAAHIPVMVIEGFLTASCMLFLRKVKPEMVELMEVQDVAA